MDKEGKLRIRIIVAVLHKDGETTRKKMDEKVDLTNPWDPEVVALTIANKMYESQVAQCEQKGCRLTK